MKAEEAESRGYVYGLLSLVYRQEPTMEFLEQIRRPEFASALNELGVGLGEDFWNISEEQLLEELALEYTRLFIGPGRHISPHESVHRVRNGISNAVHRKGEGRLWGDSTVKVKAFIKSSGLKYRSGFKGMPDHISVEFEFMHRLVKAEEEARKENDRPKLKKILNAQRRFFNEHISKWVPQFTERIAKEAKLDFYRKIAVLTKAFILSEKEGMRDV